MTRISRASSNTTSLKPISDQTQIDAIANAIDNFDLTGSAAWSQLMELSSNTEFDSIEADSDAIFREGADRFQVVGTVYVILNYGGKHDGVSMNDSYPVQIAGHFEGGQPIIDEVSVDTSSFYGDDASTV